MLRVRNSWVAYDFDCAVMQFGQYIDAELSEFDLPEDKEQRRKIEKVRREKRRRLEQLLGIQHKPTNVNPAKLPSNVLGIKVSRG